MADLRIGVVGLGMRSSLATLAHRPGEGSAVVAVCDPGPARHTAVDRFGAGVTVVTEHRELLTLGLDAVFVLSPDDTHAAITLDVLQAGIAAFVEKPLAITTADCDALLSTARETGSRLYVGHNMRHMPVVQTMRELITEGAVGEVKSVWCRHFVGHGGEFYFKDWHADRSRSTGLLLQKAAHDIDVIHWLAGGVGRLVQAMGALAVYGDIADRSGQGADLMRDWFDPASNWPPTALTGLNPVVDVEDLSMLNMVLDNGVLAAYQQCHFTPDYWRNYTVIGTHGRLENFGDGPGGVVKVWNARRSGYREDADHTVELPAAEGGHGGADPVLVAEFLRFAREGGATLTSPIAAREAVAVGCAATESLRGGAGAVAVPALPADLVAYFAGGQAIAGGQA